MSESKAPNLPKPVRTLFLIVIVITPLYWLIMTEHGRLSYDQMLLSLFGKDTISLKIENLGADITEEMFLEQFPDVDIVCEDRSTEFGDRLCQASLGAFNELPSQHMSLFFSNNSLQALKVVYQLAYHDLAVEKMEIQVKAEGQPLDFSSEMIQWRTPAGVVLLNRIVPKRHEDAAIMWIAK
ncbi:hypothetical protein [Solemya velum gill symbiont]|uniref:hypothetical protein n=1 Tax=Solemya velum gill symbiont TaxID=2340 RepID=UPI000995F12F|nr:hypothetical protein [Solemya velum gill symbiont]OOZ45064.1 hypothetical protein BOW37_04340 [Solemya velum gill symbiont]OOZ47744.1 hypothetical protein BOW38_00900 [Solemya velum gill symbiont]OOZ50395.1 hypothetical protein BOW39_03165 [Solemya velum gill symbiont]OOZ52702.1 hypothetical protein BOW40_00905 [Solemya velum gill symbiont]OOZ55909.1 hypothetical protein BOW41_00910 [Solemya velum gill symbiont]